MSPINLPPSPSHDNMLYLEPMGCPLLGSRKESLLLHDMYPILYL